MVDALLALTLTAVLDRAATYVAQFQRELSGFVAEEQYQQDWTALPHHLWKPDAERHRNLVSDVTLERVGTDWRLVRQVRMQDHVAVTDPSADYNIGEITRTVNSPLFAIKFLEAANRWRCRFKTSSDRLPATVAGQPDVPGAFRTSIEVWVVEYEERERPTLIRDAANRGRDVPARGRFWIEADTGRVIMSELVAQSRDIRGTIDVSYQSEPVGGLLLPIEMREWYEGLKNGSKVEAVATYGRFRNIQE